MSKNWRVVVCVLLSVLPLKAEENVQNEASVQLTEQVESAEATASDKVVSKEKVQELLENAKQAQVPQAVYWSLGAVILTGILWLRWRARKLYFPENPTPQRLGGSVGARCGGVLQFCNKRQPVSEQYKQFKKDFF